MRVLRIEEDEFARTEGDGRLSRVATPLFRSRDGVAENRGLFSDIDKDDASRFLFFTGAFVDADGMAVATAEAAFCDLGWDVASGIDDASCIE
jgi:hypothetical protein